MSRLTESPAWRALAAHQTKIAAVPLRELFETDPRRAQKFSLEFGDILLDYSKHLLKAETLRLLVDLAESARVPEWIRRMYAGEAINTTENRAALHVALRSDRVTFPERGDVMPQVRGTLERMRVLVEEIRRGALIGATGKPFTDVVNIGIGGSDLGPRMVTRALRHCTDGLRTHFVANIDPADLEAALKGLDPSATLFIVASKTFTTAETLENAKRARDWIQSGLGKAGADRAKLARHFVAITANAAAAASWGVPAERVFPLWDWVGGRYSIWSAIGLPVALATGMERFEELLEGGREMDAHFHTAPLHQNMPVLLALLSVWYVNFFGSQSRAVLPYSEDLRAFPDYLQQLEMESNGKRVDRDGNEVDYATAPVVWGASGTPSQHSFHQLLHQGTRLVPVDFIVIAEQEGPREAHSALVANALAQSAALMQGDPAPGEPHRVLPGNRPSSLLLLKRLSPRALGQLIALYEHKVFVEGVIWNINSFDQWGVEMGKRLARTLLPRLAEGGDDAALDPSTRALLERLRGR